MKFYLKMTLVMLTLLSVLFGAGGSILISMSFQESLEREKAVALGNYRMVWGTLQIINNIQPSLNKEMLTQTMEQLYLQSGAFWTALTVSTDEEVVFGSEVTQPSLCPTIQDNTKPTLGSCLMRINQNDLGEYYLVLSGALEMQKDTLYITAIHSINDLYTTRVSQEDIYFWVFLVMELVCGLAAYTISRLLTAPLQDLSQASRKIASGDYASRIVVRSQDEIGELACDFNAMAEQLSLTAKQKEHTLEQLRQSFERQERFIGSFAHEMKTPMTSLIGYADLIRSGVLSADEQAEAADYIYAESKRLENLSRKLLDLLVTRQQEIVLIPVCPKDLVEHVARQLELIYQRKSLSNKPIQVTCDCEDGICNLEPDLIRSLLLNLADNAQKAMDHGGELHFRVELTELGCRIAVSDTGPGIPPDALAHLTEAFYRADKARSRKQGGFGLGLSLCQEIVLAHRGSLQFVNRPEGGMCVIAELQGGRP